MSETTRRADDYVFGEDWPCCVCDTVRATAVLDDYCSKCPYRSKFRTGQSDPVLIIALQKSYELLNNCYNEATKENQLAIRKILPARYSNSFEFKG